MLETDLVNQDQAAHWNDVAGRTWAELRDVIDQVLAPFEALLIDEIRPADGGRILDVGCGAGAVTLAAARLAGPEGFCLGADISAPLIEAAWARAGSEGVASARFRQADAQAYPFEPGSFDAIVSRFGVMFFDDPVAAFRNLRSAARTGAKLACVTWRSAAENSFMTTAERAAAPFLPDLPRRDAGGPGQFGLADPEHARAILEESGWQDIALRPVDVPCSMPRRDLWTYVTRMGPVGALFPSLDESKKAEVGRRVEAAFEPFVRDDTVHFTSACWMMTARA